MFLVVVSSPKRLDITTAKFASVRHMIERVQDNDSRDFDPKVNVEGQIKFSCKCIIILASVLGT